MELAETRKLRFDVQPLSRLPTVSSVEAVHPCGSGRDLGHYGAFRSFSSPTRSDIGSMLALSMRQRVREIGIRMALGATPRDVLRVVIRQGMALVAIGMAIGLAGPVALTGVLKALLFEVTPTDLATYVLVSARAIGRGLAGVLPAGAAGCASRESWRKLQLGAPG